MKKTIIALSLLTALALTSCGSESSSSSKASTTAASSTEVTSETISETTPETTAESTSASAAETTAASTEQVTAPQNEVGYEGMKAVFADSVKAGDYHINVDSSSSMFKIADCILHVNGSKMTADIIIDSKSYDALFMGTKEEAEKADDTGRITYTENESGQSVFTVPVEALDKKIECAALSAKKQEWYGRELVFRADSLPDEAFAENRYTSTTDLGLEDGEYMIDVTLEGGSGRASIQSPTKFTVKNGGALAEIIWSSDKYDQMVVQGATYLPEIIDGHSVFNVDIIGFDYKMPVGAETTAMSEPHMIDYTLYFDSSTIKKCD